MYWICLKPHLPWYTGWLDQLELVARDVSLIKCDIEGADLYAMRGARETLEQHKPTVIIEITPWHLEGFGLEVKDVTGFFDSLGYQCFRYDNGTPQGAHVRPTTSGGVRRAFAGISGASDDRTISLAPSVSYGIATAARNLDVHLKARLLCSLNSFRVTFIPGVASRTSVISY